MKVAIFKYLASKCGTTLGGECLDVEMMQEEMNEFMESVDVVDIKVNTFKPDRHNNGGQDEVWIVYTIMYR